MIDSRVYSVGATNVTVPNNGTYEFKPPRDLAGLFINYVGGATLALVGATGMTTGQGVLLNASEITPINGPANFFLAASGATATVAIGLLFSAKDPDSIA